jgi:hypothetical protein
MKSRLNILIAAAVLLLFFNIIKWAGVFNTGAGEKSGSAAIRGLQIAFQRPADAKSARVIRNLFSGGPAGEFFAQSGGDAGNAARKNAPAAQTPTAVPEKKWPDFKISGTASSEGKKCAFFS